MLAGLTGCLGIEVEVAGPPTSNTMQEPYPSTSGTSGVASAGARGTFTDAGPTPKPMGTLAPDNQGPKEVLDQAIEKLDATKSFYFTVELHHGSVIDGKGQTFTYTGRGAAGDQGRFISILRDPADIFFYVEIDGGSGFCQDSRGTVKDRSPMDGGPRGAISPYALIAYLRHFDYVEAAPDLGGEANKRMYRYEPSLIEIARIDDRHKLAMDLVETVAGVVTIDANTGLPTTQSVELILRTAAGLENVSATMQFEDFGEPFDPETLRLRGG